MDVRNDISLGLAAAIDSAKDPSTRQVLAVIAAAFERDTSTGELGSLLRGVQQLLSTGLPIRDIADALYSNPIVTDSLKQGQPNSAKDALIPQLKSALFELRDSGIPESSLRFVSESGLGLDEIVRALRDFPQMRDLLESESAPQVRGAVAKMISYFRDSGRTTHDDPSLMDNRPTLAWNGVRGSWFDRYMKRLQSADEQNILSERFANAGATNDVSLRLSSTSDEDELPLDTNTRQVIGRMVAEFGRQMTPEAARALMQGIQQLLVSGVPVRDIAAAMYTTPGVINALKQGDPEAAKEILIPQLKAALVELQKSGVPENVLHFVSESGLGLTEIVTVLRTLPHIRELLMQGTATSTRQAIAEINNFLRENNRALHDDPSLMDRQPTLLWNGIPGEWFAAYLKRIREAERQRLRLGRNAAAVNSPATAPIDTPAQSTFGDLRNWIIGAAVALAVLLVLWRC